MNGGAMQGLAPQHFSMINTYPNQHQQHKQIQQKQRQVAQQQKLFQQQQQQQLEEQNNANLHKSSEQQAQGSWMNGPPPGSIPPRSENNTVSNENSRVNNQNHNFVREKKEKPLNPNYMNKSNPNNKGIYLLCIHLTLYQSNYLFNYLIITKHMSNHVIQK
jgi:hypothetical protein